MSKELETFRKIVKGFTETFNMAIHHPKDTIVKWEGVEEIEKALKDYERYKPLIENIQNGLTDTIAVEDLKVLLKRSKALEIIRSVYKFVVKEEITANGKIYYLLFIDNAIKPAIVISQEKYDLLKEVLL